MTGGASASEPHTLGGAGKHTRGTKQDGQWELLAKQGKDTWDRARQAPSLTWYFPFRSVTPW